HRVCSVRERQAFVSAYRWHLKNWLPTDVRAPWLDLGCGQGQLMSLAIAAGFRSVLGIDLSSEMLAACRQLGFDVRQEDAVAFIASAPTASFGVVSAFDFLEHLSRDSALGLLREARRIVTPDGVVLIKVPNGASPYVGDIFFSDLT